MTATTLEALSQATTTSIEGLWREIQPYSRAITVGTHSYLPDGRPLRAGFATGLVTGSFKERGALVGMLALQRNGHREVVAYSAGNHAAGVALGAKVMDMSVQVYVPSYTPDVKIENTLRLGAGHVTVEVYGKDIESAHMAADLYATQNDAPILKPSDIMVGYGQGTVAYELVSRDPHIDHLLVPAGYGGLALGCIEAIKQAGLRTKVYGVKLNTKGELCEGAHVSQLSEAAESVISDNPNLWGGMLYVDPADVGKMIDLEDVSRAEAREAMGDVAYHEFPEATALLGAAAAHRYHESFAGNVATIVTGSNADRKKLDELHRTFTKTRRLLGERGFRMADGYPFRHSIA